MSRNPPSDGKTTPSSGRGGAYEVGYGKPPRWGQFKPGHSGNPKGRKKREDTIAGALRAELAATQKVRENGKEKTLTKAEILVKQWVRQALEGKPTAIIQIAKFEPKLLAQAVEAAARSGPPQPRGGDLTETDLSMMKWFVDALNSEQSAAPEQEGGDDQDLEADDDWRRP